MILYNIKNELNKMMLSVPADAIGYDDYRYKMITDNEIEGILPMELRTINGESRLTYDISGKENLVKCLSMKDLDRGELLKLSESMMRVSAKIREYLLEEACLVFEPDLVFRDIKTGQYAFICLPGHIKNEEDIRSDLMAMFELFLSHVGASDEQLVEAVYGLYEIVSAGPVYAKDLYESIWDLCGEKGPENGIGETVEEEEDLPEEIYEEVPLGPCRPYIPIRFFFSAACAASGLICLGLGAYMSLLGK